MSSETAPADDTAAPRKTLGQKIASELRETVMTIAIFAPIWLLFTTLAYDERYIPSESMVPALQVGDRLAVAKFAYGYDRNSLPFGLGRLLTGNAPDNPKAKIFARLPKRGDVVVFRHPHEAMVLIKRVIGLPGDTVQMRDGQLYLNGEIVKRQEIRKTAYRQSDDAHMVVAATEYRESLPGEKGSHLIHEFSDQACLDRTPIFRVPAGHVFMMGDNRDNSEDSRAPSGHRSLAAAFPEAWNCRESLTGSQAIGFVPLDDLMGRAETVLWTLHSCKHDAGLDCPAPRLWRSFHDGDRGG
jgi:signal peptidase I